MRTRIWQPEDNQRVTEIYQAMKMPYQMPDLNSPMLSLRRVVEDRAGNIIGAGAIKPVGEAFFWVKPDLGAVSRSRALHLLSRDAGYLSSDSGYDELTAWIPPQIEQDFAAALVHIGWRKSPWSSWSIRL